LQAAAGSISVPAFMPLFLPQLTRREFLKHAALAGAAMAFAPAGFAAPATPTRDENTFAFFSDSHIAADASCARNGVNMADHLAACVQELAAWPVTPARVIVNGDLAYKDGLALDYATFGKLIAPVRMLAPIHLSLGNHDARESFWQAFPLDATQAVPQRQASFFSSARANWFLVDSLDLTDHTPGKLGPAQFDWLNHALAAHAEKPAIIVCHHPLDFTGLLGLKDSAAMEKLFVQHRQVKAFVYGHTHDWHATTHASGVQLINLPPTGYVFNAGRPSGWVRCTLADNGAEFELRSLDPKHPEHAQVKKLAWRTG
jgi:hypothetical protein